GAAATRLRRAACAGRRHRLQADGAAGPGGRRRHRAAAPDPRRPARMARGTARTAAGPGRGRQPGGAGLPGQHHQRPRARGQSRRGRGVTHWHALRRPARARSVEGRRLPGRAHRHRLRPGAHAAQRGGGPARRPRLRVRARRWPGGAAAARAHRPGRGRADRDRRRTRAWPPGGGEGRRFPWRGRPRARGRGHGHGGRRAVNISAWAIRRPLPAVMVFFVLCVAGLWGFHRLPVARFPDIAFPMTTVTVVLPGASPTQLEAEVTRRIEDSVATIPNVKRIMSSVNEGVSTTMVEFQLEVDLATALDDVRDAVTRVRTDLPQDIQEPVVSKVDIGGALMTYALVAPRMSQDEASWFVDREVTRAMYGVPGVAEVTRVGGVERPVRVDLDPDALQAFGVTAGDVSSQLAKIQVERAGGRALQAGGEQVIRTIGTVADARELEDYSISLPDGRAVRLSALARVSDAAADPAEAALLDGKPVVAFSMSRTRGSSEVEVEAGVQAALEQLKANHPGIDFRLVTTAIDETHRSYDSSMTMLWEGALLALVVVWLFLRDWRATWVSAVALPLSIVPTFAVMHWLGFSLNMITLLALAVVVGILVDDAIVEIENIVRHLRMGKTPLEAAREAAG